MSTLYLSHSHKAVIFYWTNVLLSNLNNFCTPLQNDSISSIKTCFLWFWFILTDLSSPSIIKDFLLSTLESLLEICFDVSMPCFYLYKHMLFSRQTEKSRLFSWELPFKVVVFLNEEVLSRQFVEESLFVSSWTPDSKTLRMWFFFLSICFILELYLLLTFFSPVF